MEDLEPDLKRQAAATIRGFAYQCYQTIRAWLYCGPDEELRCEFAEDIDLIRRDIEGQVIEAELNQVKHEKNNVTLNSDSAVDLINNFFRHKSRNPALKLTIRLCTIADRGKEAQVDWSHASCGMDLWDQLRSRKLSNIDQAGAINLLRSHLQANTRLSSEVKTFLASSTDSVFLAEVVDRVFWDTGQPAFVEIQQEIQRILSQRERSISDPLEAQQIINRLWRNVMDLLASDADRTLTHRDLENILLQETTVSVDRNLLKQVASVAPGVAEIGQRITSLVTASLSSKEINPGDAIEIRYERVLPCEELPLLPAVCCERRGVVKDILENCQAKFLLWIHGSTGYGKTTIANLLVRDAGTQFLWVRLRGLVGFELASTLVFVLKKARDIPPTKRIIIVLDDLSLGNADTTTIELITKILDTTKEKATDALVLVSSQGFAPARLREIVADQLLTFDMPEMSRDEIAELLTNGGLADEELRRFWTTFIDARTKGHPQLVGAYIAYAKEIGWKPSPEDLVVTPETAETVRRESRRLLAESIRSPEARELARRLSVVNIAFPRDFALAVGRGNPSLQEPGHAFESLLGPWIEVIDSHQYSLSPLLEGYAASEVGEMGVASFYRIVAYSWFSQKTLNQSQFFQLVTSALLAKEDFLIAHAGYVLVTTKQEKFQIMAKELALLCLIGIAGDESLKDLHPATRHLFRAGLLRIAAATGQATTYNKLDAAILSELEPKQSDEIFRDFLFGHYVQTCATQKSPLPTKELIRRAIKAVEFFQKGLVSADYSENLRPDASVGSLVMLSTANLDNKEDLEFLFDELSRQSDDVVSLAFSGFENFIDLIPLLVDRVWMMESTSQEPQWEYCLSLFSRISLFADAQKIPWLLAGATRAKMVVFDEYLGKPELALETAREARQMLGETHPLIDLAESMVKYRGEQYAEFLNLFNKVDESTPPEHLTLERIYSLRRAIIAVSKDKSWEKVRIYAERGIALANSLADKHFAAVAVMAFGLEKAWAYHESGGRISATEQFEIALKLAEEFPDQKYSLFHILRLRFGHTLAWLSYPPAQKTASNSGQVDRSSRPFIGMFANFEDPPTEALDRSGAPYQGFWAMLAQYAGWYFPRDRVKFFASQAFRSTPEGQWYLGVLTATDALFASDLAEEDFDAALLSGLEHVRIQTVGSVLRKQGKESILTGYGNFDSPDLPTELRDQWAEVTPSEVFEPILMTLCSTDSPPQIDFRNWSGVLAKAFSSDEVILKCIEWLEIGLQAISGDRDTIRKCEEAAQKSIGQLPAIQRLAHIICCALKVLPLRDCVSAQASFLLAMPEVFYKKPLGNAFTRMVAKRWTFLAREQRFFIRSPTFYAPKILDAASQKVPTIAECAALLLVVGEAAGLSWPPNMLASLNELTQTGNSGAEITNKN